MNPRGTVAQEFRFCPRCSTQNKTSGQNPFSCEHCDFTYYFSPVVAVAGIVTDGGGRVLFLRRARDPGMGKLGLPGGFVDAGETIEEALRREAMEEVKLSLPSIEYVVSLPNLYRFKGIEIPVADVFFACRVESFEGLIQQPEEVLDLYISKPTINELNEMAFPSNRKALEIYLSSTAG